MLSIKFNLNPQKDDQEAEIKKQKKSKGEEKESLVGFVCHFHFLYLHNLTVFKKFNLKTLGKYYIIKILQQRRVVNSE